VGLPWFGIGGVEQVFEERAVMDHRLAKVLGGRFAALLAERDVVRGPVVLDDMRMVDGHVSGALLEVTDGVATDLHEISNEAVRFDHGTLRVIDEPCLVGAPLLRKPAPMFGAQRFDVQLTHALDALAELAFRVPGVAALAH